MSPEPESGKQELLNRAAREYKAFHEALHGLNEAELGQRWLGTWSIREVVGHISGWHREMSPALERLARGERPIPEGVSYDDVDAWNARFAAAVRDTPVADVLLELDRSHEHFMRSAAAIPEDRFRPGKAAYRIVDMVAAHHYKEHGDEIRAWRLSQNL
jgi:uncharacterized protein DUF1706